VNASPASIRALIVDDEAPARLLLKDLLEKDDEVVAIYEADNGEEAVRLIQEEKPDLVLLDIQMPGLDGLGVVEAIGPEVMPLTVFVTAFDRHAVRAFEANALDYILKPFGDDRMQSMLSRAKGRLQQIQMESFGQRLMRAMSQLPGTEGYQDRMAIIARETPRRELVELTMLAVLALEPAETLDCALFGFTPGIWRAEIPEIRLLHAAASRRGLEERVRVVRSR
jgi:YesN/AraC family two-component response regulator